jgi:hypothetical protein
MRGVSVLVAVRGIKAGGIMIVMMKRMRMAMRSPPVAVIVDAFLPLVRHMNSRPGPLGVLEHDFGLTASTNAAH